MKAQMFIIAAIIIAIAILSLKGVLGVYRTIEEKEFQDVEILDRQLENVRDEYENAINIAVLQQERNESGILYLKNLSTFIRQDTKNRLGAEIFYIYISLNNTRRRFSLNVGNFLGDRINGSIRVTNTQSAPVTETGDINDMETKTFDFLLNQQFNGTVNITFSYQKTGELIEEKLSFETNRDINLLFYDISLESESRLRVKDIYKVEIMQFVERPGQSLDVLTCGNGLCNETGENCFTCDIDCGLCNTVCGNNICELGEDEVTCPEDCTVSGPCTQCSDGTPAGQCVDPGNSIYYCTPSPDCSITGRCDICGGCTGEFSCQTNPNQWNFGFCYRPPPPPPLRCWVSWGDEDCNFI